MLERCHQKMSDKIALLADAARRWSQSRDRGAIEDARDVCDFLCRAGQRHELDEEQSIFPRISETAGLGDVIRVLRAEHRDHERETTALGELLSNKSPSPEQLSRCAARLLSAYRSHIELEDRKLMPVVRRFSMQTLGDITDEMQTRRGR